MQKTESLPCEAHSSAEGETVNQEVQLALEQHRCELCGSTYMQIISVGNTMVLRGLLLVEPTDGKLRYGGPTVSYTQVFKCERMVGFGR